MFSCFARFKVSFPRGTELFQPLKGELRLLLIEGVPGVYSTCPIIHFLIPFLVQLVMLIHDSCEVLGWILYAYFINGCDCIDGKRDMIF